MKNNLIIKNFRRESKGITLIALIVTIIILLILAGITTNTMTGDNNLIKRASQAKEKNRIAEETELLQQAAIQAEANNTGGPLTVELLQNAINNITDERRVLISTYGVDSLKAEYTDSNNSYIIKNDGSVSLEE